MITISTFCKTRKLTFHKITYRAQGVKLKTQGFDIVDDKMQILASFEPKDYKVGKWYLRETYIGYTGPRYFHRISLKLLNQIIPENRKHFTYASRLNLNNNG